MVTSAALWMAVLVQRDDNTKQRAAGPRSSMPKCLRIVWLIVIILPMGHVTINKHEDMCDSKRSGTHERYSVLRCTHYERLHDEQPTR